MTDERPDSLAEQAASWVPPWERPHRPPDRAYQQAHAVEEWEVDSDDETQAPAGDEGTGPTAVDDPPLPDLVDGAEPVVTDEPGSPVEALVAGEAGEPRTDLADPVDLTQAEWLLDAGAEGPPPAAEAVLEPAADAQAEVEPVAEVQAEPMADAELRATLEAILLVVDEPVAELQLAQILEEPAERVAAALEEIAAGYTAAGHGFDLRRAAGGWRLYTRPEYARYVERFVLDGQSVRLTQAALETLSVVAYKQPVTRSRISAIRGVNCDGVMRTLVTRGLIEECGTERETGAFLYRTTALFLEKLGLNSVDELPPLAPFLPDDVEEVLDASG
ncbi:SMC-Scp complex subunit ScpB [Krasilnikovia sp. M28-CT-15]|uniref:SMC-Scp complex subunit ScpB n=1 Tax=Krasilnikovia sp. M28-CT-15 TaxID=3373540 RepID=UPI0038761207